MTGRVIRSLNRRRNRARSSFSMKPLSKMLPRTKTDCNASTSKIFKGRVTANFPIMTRLPTGGRIGACAATLMPLVLSIRAHVFAAERIHADDTTVPVWAKNKCRTGRLWVYVRDDRPFGGPDPPAAVFYYSRDRGGAHPQAHLAAYAGILQADAFGGYAKLYERDRNPGPIMEAACWSHARRIFFVLADLAANAQRNAHGKTPAFVSPL